MPAIGLMQRAMVERALRQGAVGIGENHELKHGRKLAFQLIQSGLVKRLFVELSNLAYTGMVEVAAQQVPHGFDAVRRHLGFGAIHDNPFTLETVVAFALVRGVQVECPDHRKALHTAWATSPTGMLARNEHITDKIKEVTDTTSAREAPGTLIICGSAHFEGPGSLVARYPGLVWICTDRDPVTRTLDA